MLWYYVENLAQRGPVSEEQFNDLVRTGVVGPETLVWREGLAEWKPWREVSGGAPAAGAAGTPPLGLGPTASGPGAGSAPTDPAAMVEALRARGGAAFDIGSALSRGFEALKEHFLTAVGVLLIYVAIGFAFGLAGQIPLVGCMATVAQLAITGPLTASVLLFFRGVARGEKPGLDQAFLGFRQPLFVQVLLIGLITQGLMFVVMMLVIVPFGGMAVLSEMAGASSGSGMADAVLIPLMIGVGLIVGALALYVYVIWTPAYLIAADTGAGFWQAMEASRKIVHQSFMSWVGFYLLSVVLLLVGILVFCVGYLVAAALATTAFCVIWEDIGRQASAGAGEPSA
jgi:uncharacterized membrane protein